MLSRPEAGLAAYLTALLNWHRRHRFCANCGAETGIREAGYSRRCPRCGAAHFPRTDPVVIMTVEHDDRLLLGHRARLAGAPLLGARGVRRARRGGRGGGRARGPRGVGDRRPRSEVRQFAAVAVPGSLMLGFEAQSDGGEPRASDGELDEVRWFTREEVHAGVEGTHPELLLPPGVSIARFLIDRWLARPGA